MSSKKKKVPTLQSRMNVFTKLSPVEDVVKAQVGKKFEVEGSWWEDECLEDDEDKMFTCEVTGFKMKKKIKGIAQPRVAIYFRLTGSAADTISDESDLWMELDAYSKLRSDYEKFIMTQEVFVDLISEGVSESCFSTHANFGTDLRKSTDPKVVAKMVFCNRNHDLLWELIQEKIKGRYVATFARHL